MNDELNRLDRLCAEKIMGFECILHSKKENLYYVYLDDVYQRNRGIIGIDYTPTRNIAQAWELLEKLNPYSIRIIKTHLWNISLTIKVGDGDSATYAAYEESIQETAPLSIVKACLKVAAYDH